MALEEAAASQLPMLEVLAARDCKRAASGSGEVADAVIDACAREDGQKRRAHRTAPRASTLSEAWMWVPLQHCLELGECSAHSPRTTC